MKKILLLIPIWLLLLGCTSAPEENTMLEIVEVEIDLPSNVNEGETLHIRSHITHGEENVEDAQEVQLEIWNVEEGKEASELLDAEHVGDGNYEGIYSFGKKGIYRVQSHVTARDMHVMPTKQVVVGDLTDEEIETILENEQTVGEGNHGSNGSHH
ncbi:FixH family protein [Sutcliffiella rhizosphaerae]|uniref:YtkA-like domain-containing protein n=1 Tax=Sutcliffiella rhizosphaerae TaxID=2880967 RepID=A0ABN8A7P2_9BACI|nr:FixH family protein [Sutcliffiella rhizosphaerae]CAG9619952.1 hypothetical protein BACCIP111883_00720 [Sutcliffiella rhizosphaerae]